MVVDAVRTYFDAASGFTELTRKRAVAAAKTLLKTGDDRSAGADGPGGIVRAGHDIQSLAAELIETSQANRAALNALVETEVRRVLDRFDLVRRDDYERVVRRVAELERRLAAQRVPAARPASTTEVPLEADAVGETGAAGEAPVPGEAGSGGDAEPGGERHGATVHPAGDAVAEPEDGSAESGADAQSASGDAVIGGETPNGPEGGSGSTAEAVPVEKDGQAADPRATVADAGDESKRKTAGTTIDASEEQETGTEADAEETESGSEDPDQAAGGSRQRSGSAGKGAKTTGKQTASKAANKSGKSKSTTKRSGGRAKNTAPAKKNEQQ